MIEIEPLNGVTVSVTVSGNTELRVTRGIKIESTPISFWRQRVTTHCRVRCCPSIGDPEYICGVRPRVNLIVISEFAAVPNKLRSKLKFQ